MATSFFTSGFPEPSIVQIIVSKIAGSWWVWLLHGVALVWMGWWTRRWWGGRLLLLSLLLLSIICARILIKDHARERASEKAWNDLRGTLTTPLLSDGLKFPVGTVVRWDSENAGHLLTAELNGEQQVTAGVVLRGDVEDRCTDWWRGTLAEDAVLRGWHCRAGEINIYNDGELRWCVLATVEHRSVGDLPAGTAVLLDPGEGSGTLLHFLEHGMTVSPGNVMVNSGEWLYTDADGRVVIGK